LFGRGKRWLLLPLPVGIIEVDRSYNIQALNQTARQFCAIQGPVLGQDLLHLMEEVPARPLRTLIDQAFRTGTTPQGIEVTVSGSIGKPRKLQITATPHSGQDSVSASTWQPQVLQRLCSSLSLTTLLCLLCSR
jgi:nitrogen fixation/metabolism regulation signal transduction histidine kinase